MNDLNVVVALITRENDYQAEQAAAAISAAARLGVKLQVLYADNDAVNQTQQIVKVIQDPIQRPTAILVEPVGTGMIQVAKAAVAAGIGWGVLNREPEYLTELRRDRRAPTYCVTVDQEEVGRIQGKQIAALVREGNILYVEGPSSSTVVILRGKGMRSTKPPQVLVKSLKGDWTERSGQQAVRSWLSLSTSRQLHIRAVVCQNDAMAMGARKALLDLTEKDREDWHNIPFTGCDGVSRSGQEWVRRGMLSATVIAPATAGTAVEVLVKAARDGSEPPERTQIAPVSFPPIADLHMRPDTTAHPKGVVLNLQPHS
jgi:ABC-type sugar transport system substrate-binding protein